MVSKKQKDLDVMLAHVEFAYNRAPRNTTKASPFEVIYGVNIQIMNKDAMKKDAPSELRQC